MNAKRALIPLAAAVLTMGAAVGTANAAQPAGTVAARDTHGCPYGAICVWPSANFGGKRHDYYWCGPLNVGMAGPVSYYNNQTKGTRAWFKTRGGWNVRTQGAPSYDAHFGTYKSYIYAVRPC